MPLALTNFEEYIQGYSQISTIDEDENYVAMRDNVDYPRDRWLMDRLDTLCAHGVWGVDDVLVVCW